METQRKRGSEGMRARRTQCMRSFWRQGTYAGGTRGAGRGSREKV